jgi:hypothetical protein
MNKRISKTESFNRSKAEYIDFYQRTFPVSHMVFSVLEIGFNLESLNALQNIFPNALINTLDMIDKLPMSKTDIEEKGFFVYAMGKKPDGKDGLSLMSISSKFDIIIDTGNVYPSIARQMVFNHLYLNNLNPHGLYYLESIDKISKNDKDPVDQCLAFVKALFDFDRSFCNKNISKESISKLIDITEWCDMSKDDKIAGFRKQKEAEVKSKKPTLPSTTKFASNALQNKQSADNRNDKESDIPDINIQFFSKEPLAIERREVFGPVHKDILASFFGSAMESPEIYEMYGSNSDFYIADIDPSSDKFRLEIARSMFTLCVNDARIFDALLNKTIPVIITDHIIADKNSSIDAFPWKIVCTPSNASLIIGNVYRNSDGMSQYINNGQKILKKILK